MSWEKRIIDEDELLPFLPVKADFRHRVIGLLAHQKQSWPMLREAIAGFGEIKSKKLWVKNSIVHAQYNPQRIVSTSASVDAAAIKQRPCFLCPENLPPEEKGIDAGNDFVVLCNPFPVLKNHTVIAARRHIPQLIEGNFDLILDLSLDLGEEWFTLYNGPRCGASAADHLHFQACSREALPIIPEIEIWERRQIKQIGAIDAFTLQDYRINLLAARSSERKVLFNWFNNALNKLADVMKETEEPMINMIVTYNDPRWTVIIFPRGKHRPSCYDAEGESRLTVSPAAIDLAGVLVVPKAEDFARIKVGDVEKIYTEVSLDDERFRRIC